MERVRSADRFWWRNWYPQPVIDFIEGIDFSEIIKEVTGVQEPRESGFFTFEGNHDDPDV